jgi:hypothetical protein
VGRCAVDASGSGYGPVVGPCKHGNEPPGSVEGSKFLNYVSDYQLLKKDSAPWN